ncbi:hypothetical protein J8137_23770, partial [Lactiplantibacillus plantarum]|nr:hypothetical protein [Lactiplantibacillus plantarum]
MVGINFSTLFFKFSEQWPLDFIIGQLVDLLVQAFYVLTKSSSEQAIIVGSELLFNLSFNNLSIIMAM